MISGEILGQNCIQFLDAARNDLFLSKNYFIKNSVNMLSTCGLLKSEVPFVYSYSKEMPFYISVRRCLQFLE